MGVGADVVHLLGVHGSGHCVDTEVLPLGYLVEKRPSVKLDQRFGVGFATFDTYICINDNVKKISSWRGAVFFIRSPESLR